MSPQELLVQFLPPYSPDLNPMNKLFKKSSLKANKWLLDITDIESFVLHAFTSITIDNIKLKNGYNILFD